jgi:DNA mismatch repair protein MutH
MDREQAYKELQKLAGQDLFGLAKQYEVTVWNAKTGKQNKGWFGHVVEHYLGLPRNSAQSPNFGSWELKTTSVKRLKNGLIIPKETIALTMIDPFEVTLKPFKDSHLFSKLKKMILVARLVDTKFQDRGFVHSVSTFDLSDRQILSQIEQDYETVKKAISLNGFESLTAKMGILVQPRTKGPGHGSTSRAFYAKKELVKLIIGNR